jgi:ATP-dependent DNA helicase RecG
MVRYWQREFDVLVCSTIIESGLDIPNANTLIIERAELFGLAQLHQLRGRIGRGPAASQCVLLLDRWLPPETLERLRFFAAHGDGFALAEEDLRRRGPGDVWGVRQHGAPGFRLANPLRDADLVKTCAADAAALLASDPRLADPAHRPLRRHLEDSFRHLLPLAAG